MGTTAADNAGDGDGDETGKRLWLNQREGGAAVSGS
jgi:hypothetical protein